MRSVPPVVFVSLLGLAACAPAGSSAFVSGNAPLSPECAITDADLVISTGLYDVLSKGTDKKTCIRPYRMSLVINSNLVANTNAAVGRVEPNTLLVQYADVTLMDKTEAPFGFPELPNPYRVYTSASISPATGDEPSQGWVQLDAIPAAYGELLRGSAGDSILVELQLAGKTTGDVQVDFPPFLYPLAICSDCLSACVTDSRFADPAVLTDLNSGKCSDNRPQDDRVCVDPGC